MSLADEIKVGPVNGKAKEGSTAGPSAAQLAAEEEAEAELVAAVKSGSGKRLRAAMRRVRELDD